MREAWFYDGATRALMDENRLTVARDVNPNDAATILAALRGPHGAFADIVADMLAYEAEKFDRPALVFDVIGERTDADGIHESWLFVGIEDREEADRLAAEAMEAVGRTYSRAFVREAEPVDLNVSGADLVDAFSEWREQLKAATREEPAVD